MMFGSTQWECSESIRPELSSELAQLRDGKAEYGTRAILKPLAQKNKPVVARARAISLRHIPLRQSNRGLTKLRYNDFKDDALSRSDCSPPHSAENAISSRCDLNPVSGMHTFAVLGHRAHGETDVKRSLTHFTVGNELSDPTKYFHFCR